MSLINEKQQATIQPHGGLLVNREVSGTAREQLIKEAENLVPITLNSWSLSDLELIAIGGFSPLTGFMKEADYTKVVEDLHLENGLVWSIPITLPITTEQSQNFDIDSRIALYGEDDVLYGGLHLEEKYTYDKQKEAQLVYGTTDVDHPGVKKVYEKGDVHLAGPIYLLNRPKHDEFVDYHL